MVFVFVLFVFFAFCFVLFVLFCVFWGFGAAGRAEQMSWRRLALAFRKLGDFFGDLS